MSQQHVFASPAAVECHDTKKKHPYNELMKLVREARDEGLEGPRVLGLTATPASADTISETSEKLNELCKNMANAQIEQVQVEHSRTPHLRCTRPHTGPFPSVRVLPHSEGTVYAL
jgi:hypothetical protein